MINSYNSMAKVLQRFQNDNAVGINISFSNGLRVHEFQKKKKED